MNDLRLSLSIKLYNPAPKPEKPRCDPMYRPMSTKDLKKELMKNWKKFGGYDYK